MLILTEPGSNVLIKEKALSPIYLSVDGKLTEEIRLPSKAPPAIPTVPEGIVNGPVSPHVSG